MALPSIFISSMNYCLETVLFNYREIIVAKLEENEKTKRGLRNYCQNNKLNELEISLSVIH